jgi:hypothetical protein
VERRVASTVTTTAGPNSMARRGVGGGRVMMDAGRAVAQFGAVASSTTDLTRAMQIFTLKLDQWLMAMTADTSQTYL